MLIAKKNNNGFTLIELAMVIVIIGLIIGGVLTGRDLVRAAELRSIIRESEAYKSSVNTFKTKYNNAIPGDMINATDYFGIKADCSDRTEFSKTCNGNGNGKIDSAASTVTIGNESFLFWQHLAMAGLIGASLNGVEGTIGSLDVDSGINTPYSKISDASWATINQDYSSGGLTMHFRINFKNFLSIGKNVSGGWNSLAILTPSENYNIDQKIDDGKPATGRFIARYWSIVNSTTHTSTSCTNAATDTDFTADYNLTNTTISCVPQFNDVF